MIAQGYRLGMEKALEIINSLAIDVDPYNRDMLIKIADTAMTGKSIESVKDKLDGIVVDAVMTVAEKANKKVIVDDDDVMIKKQKGGKMDDALLIKGVVLDKTRVAESMPRKVQNAKVALVDSALEIKKTQIKGEDQDQLLGAGRGFRRAGTRYI